MDDFSKRLKEIMNEKGVKGKDLAVHLGVTENVISEYRTGKSKPSFDKIILIAEKLGVTLDYLMRGKNESLSPEIKEFLDICHQHNIQPEQVVSNMQIITENQKKIDSLALQNMVSAISFFKKIDCPWQKK